jgi:hypothetical protein
MMNEIHSTDLNSSFFIHQSSLPLQLMDRVLTQTLAVLL